MFAKFCKLVNVQDVYNQSFMISATEYQKKLFKKKMLLEDVKEVERMRNIVYEKYSEGNFGVDAKYWFKTITKKINYLKEITTASVEQNLGVEQVNMLVQQFDKITQKNAASSEELASSSEEMSSLAENLKKIVMFFKLD